jgi:DNA mismatch endonuclease (patch repair protein)
MQPRTNAPYWRTKIASNIARDARTDQELANAGWTILRVWEHEPIEEAAKRVEDVVTARLRSDSARGTPGGDLLRRST